LAESGKHDVGQWVGFWGAGFMGCAVSRARGLAVYGARGCAGPRARGVWTARFRRMAVSEL